MLNDPGVHFRTPGALGKTEKLNRIAIIDRLQPVGTPESLVDPSGLRVLADAASAARHAAARRRILFLCSSIRFRRFNSRISAASVIVTPGGRRHDVANGASFDPIWKDWHRIPTAPAGRRRAHAAWIDGQLVIAGGCPSATTWSSTPRINR
jgi:hypothetical protein